MEFASEMVVRAALSELAITEVPTTLSPDGRSRRPHLQTWRDGWRHLKFLLMLSPRWLFFYPGAILFGIGLVAQGVIFAGPLALGRVVLDIHTMLFAGGAMIIGLQMVIFSVFVKTAAAAHGVLPSGSNFWAFVSRFSLERGIVLGAGVALAGFVLAGYPLWIWISSDFSDLEPRDIMRIPFRRLTLSVIGIESFYLRSCSPFSCGTWTASRRLRNCAPALCHGDRYSITYGSKARRTRQSASDEHSSADCGWHTLRLIASITSPRRIAWRCSLQHGSDGTCTGASLKIAR